MPECIIFNVRIHIEIPILLLFFAFTLSESIKTNLIIFRTCYVTLGYNKSDCALLGSNNVTNATAHLETIVEPYAAVINMVHGTTDAFISAILCMFIGPWTDKFGRKPILILPVIGFTVSFILLIIFALLENISPWYSLLFSLPVLGTGGFASYLTVILCYITDITSETNRGMRMSVFEAVLAVGIFLGNISSSYIFAATNYPTVFAISAFCCVLVLLFTVFFMPESLQTQPETQGRFRGLFRISHLGDMVKTTFKRRLNYDRFIVISCVFALSLYILALNGESGLTFLFLREKFNWSLQHFTIFSATHNVCWVLGTILGTYFLHKKFKIPETVLILAGFMSMFAGMLYLGFARYLWDIYFATVTRSLGGVVSPMVRSLVSKIVPSEEVSKVFSLIVVAESLIGMGGSPIFTAIYNATININAAIFCFVSAGIFLFEIFIAIGIILAKMSSQPTINYEIVNEDQDRADVYS